MSTYARRGDGTMILYNRRKDRWGRDTGLILLYYGSSGTGRTDRRDGNKEETRRNHLPKKVCREAQSCSRAPTFRKSLTPWGAMASIYLSASQKHSSQRKMEGHDCTRAGVYLREHRLLPARPSALSPVLASATLDLSHIWDKRWQHE